MVLFGLVLMIINGGGFWLWSLGADEVMVMVDSDDSGRHNGVDPLAVVVTMVVMVWWSWKV